MKCIIHILIVLAIIAVGSCIRQKADSNVDKEVSKSDCRFDISLFYQPDTDSFEEDEEEVYVYKAHRKVSLGGYVTIEDLDSLFGEPFMCNLTKQTMKDWALYEQESTVVDYLPETPEDTLLMMRRVYGKQRDWMVWINLEVLDSDSLRVLNFIAYNNDFVDF